MTLDPATSLVAIQEVLADVDLVLVMIVNPCFGGQALIPFTLNKVRQLADTLEERHFSYRIEVDGGVNMGTLDQVLLAGADVLVIGSAIFAGEEGIGASVRRFRAAINEKRPTWQS